MATFISSDIQLLMIGQAAVKTTGRPEAMNDGEIGIFTPSGTRITESTAATVKEFVIIKKTPGGVPLISSVIKTADIYSVKARPFVAGVLQVSNLGYNGASGSIDTINDNNYILRFDFPQGYVSNDGGIKIRNAFYKSDVSTTEFEVASNLLENCVAEFSHDADRLIKTEMLSDNAGTAVVPTLSANYGSRWAAFSGAHGLIAGNLVRIGTATTDPVYVIKTVSGNNVEFTTSYQGTSATGITTESISVLTGSFGLRFTTVEPGHVTGKLHANLEPVSFRLYGENFGTTTFATPVAAKAGNGTEKQVKELEWFAQGNEGYIYRKGEPGIFPSRAEAIGDYDIINIVIKELHKDSISVKPMNKMYTLALPVDTPAYAATGTADDITDILEILANGALDGSLTV